MLIILILLFSGYWLPLFAPSGSELLPLSNEIAPLEKQAADSTWQTPSFKKYKTTWVNQRESLTRARFVPFSFDPNNLPIEQWRKMGMPEWKIKIIKNYEAAGGKFYTKKDFSKIYCITDDEFQLLAPYIAISKKLASNFLPAEHETSVPVIVDINSADTTQLQVLKGIGTTFAHRIVKYRNLLGGFVKENQLLEVYGMDTIRYNLFKSQLTIDPSHIQRININTATIKELNKHPYIDYFIARSIVQYREKNGKYTDVKEIIQAKLIFGSLYDKIAPYLTVN
jgi:competence ComEA-like helix-hairpin-helix protein